MYLSQRTSSAYGNPDKPKPWENCAVINFKTAKAPGLTIPLLLLARADEVIE